MALVPRRPSDNRPGARAEPPQQSSSRNTRITPGWQNCWLQIRELVVEALSTHALRFFIQLFIRCEKYIFSQVNIVANSCYMKCSFCERVHRSKLQIRSVENLQDSNGACCPELRESKMKLNQTAQALAAGRT
jgi:hypothetical protein